MKSFFRQSLRFRNETIADPFLIDGETNHLPKRCLDYRSADAPFENELDITPAIK